MIEYEGREFDDSKLRPYSLSRKVADNFYHDECEIFVVYGMPEGIGKTGYVSHTQADVEGYRICKDRESSFLFAD